MSLIIDLIIDLIINIFIGVIFSLGVGHVLIPQHIIHAPDSSFYQDKIVIHNGKCYNFVPYIIRS